MVKDTMLALYANIKRDCDSKVLYYHDIHKDKPFTNMSTEIELFKQHIEVLKNEGFKIVSEISQKEFEVMITFDDGWKGLYESFDFFIENKIPVKLFLISSRIGQKNYLTKDEIESMLKTKLLTIGSHTVNHLNLDEIEDNQVDTEIISSKKRLEDLFGVEIESICYPRGRFNEYIVKKSKSAGYTTQYSCLPGNYFNEPYENVKRRNFVQHESPSAFRSWLYGGGMAFEERYKKLHIRER